MKALLRTRCGCTKMIDITERRPDIRVPLTQKMDWNWAAWSVDEMPKPNFQYRTFKLYGVGALPYGSGDVTVYEEAE